MIIVASAEDGESKWFDNIAPGTIFTDLNDICIKLEPCFADYVAASLLTGQTYTQYAFCGINSTVRVLPIQFQKVEQ